MRVVRLSLLFIALSSGAVVFGQESAPVGEGASVTAPEDVEDQVVVRGRRLADLRFQVQAARERAYAIFNEINSNDDFDIYCDNERKYHSRATRRVCRARFEGKISADAGQEYLFALRWSCRTPEGLHGCMFDPGAAPSAAALSAAQGIEGQLGGKRNQLKAEIERLANENPQFAQAILDFYGANQQLEAARSQRGN